MTVQETGKTQNSNVAVMNVIFYYAAINPGIQKIALPAMAGIVPEKILKVDGYINLMRDSFAFSPFGENRGFARRYAGEQQSSGLLHSHDSNPSFPRPTKNTTRWVVFFVAKEQ